MEPTFPRKPDPKGIAELPSAWDGGGGGVSSRVMVTLGGHPSVL